MDSIQGYFWADDGGLQAYELQAGRLQSWAAHARRKPEKSAVVGIATVTDAEDKEVQMAFSAGKKVEALLVLKKCTVKFVAETGYSGDMQRMERVWPTIPKRG